MKRNTLLIGILLLVVFTMAGFSIFSSTVLVNAQIKITYDIRAMSDAISDIRINLQEEFLKVEAYVNGNITKEVAIEEIEVIEEKISAQLEVLEAKGVDTKELRALISGEDEIRDLLFVYRSDFVTYVEEFDEIVKVVDKEVDSIRLLLNEVSGKAKIKITSVVTRNIIMLTIVVLLIGGIAFFMIRAVGKPPAKKKRWGLF